VTLVDEGTVAGGPRRQQNFYSDVLGRIVKTEILNWQGGSVYSATVNTYNVRDQVTQARQYAGADGSGTYQDTTMTYDGYGRLKTRHVPEQNVATNTVWTYNADDTVETVTDARGASQTFGYNNRRLTTSITYAAPTGSGIAVPSPVTFTYDAAGNRLGMIDGLGSKAYEYDALSRLLHETRQFAVGTFVINYSYNLAGQLSSVTDPFGASFTYTRDVQGRLKTVTGSPYAGASNYVNDVAYRAWGAPKTVSYNGSNSVINFNVRLHPTEFRLTANGTGTSIMRENYSYFADGRLQALTDLDDTPGTNPPATLRFLSRNYSYDHVGRATGGQGTGSGSMPGVPYSQSYSYDQFGNMTLRSGSYYNYSQSPAASDAATYINNRRTNWAYNAEGEATSTPVTSTDAPRTMTYDAAGRMITTIETGQFNTLTYTATYDGDGKLAYETSNTSPGTSSTSFIVRSTVLGDEPLTRLDQSGNKQITHVPAEGLLFATQRASGAPGPFVLLTQRNPLGTTETTKAVYDPLGNYIPFQANGDPRPPAGSYNSGSMSGLASSLSNANNYALGCVVDGLPTNCKLAGQIIARDQAKKLGVLGLALTPDVMRIMTSFTAVGIESRTVPGVVSKKVTVELPNGRGFTWTMGASELWTQFIIAPGLENSFEQNPQNSAPNENAIRDGLKKALSDTDCAKLVDALLNAVATKKNPLVSQYIQGGIMGMFEAVMLEDGLTRNPPPGSAGHGNPIGNIAQGNAQIFVESRPFGSADQLQTDVKGVLAELMHLGGQKASYTDRAFANIVHNDYPKLTTSIWPGDKSYKYHKDALKDDNHIGWSYYWHYAVNRTCF
jgi:YD repeat-containing protein